jgi:TPR repeat protein
MHVRAADMASDSSSAELQKQAASGHPAAELALGKALSQSKDPKDKAAAAEWFRKAALQGNTDAQWMLGSAYMAGNGVPHDMPQALEWMRKSLADGSADHMATYGMMLGLSGMLTGKENESLDWIRRSADAGSTKGMAMMGMFQLSGRFGVSKDPAAAEQWFLKAANKGDADAQMMLGSMYIENMFGHTDVAAGVRWLRQAAQQGQVSAQGTLGYFLVSGDKGVPKNPVEGVQWANKAVSKNDSVGYYALGFAYQHGEGEPVDPAQAWYHFAVATRLDTKHQLSKVGIHMSEVATHLSAKDLAQLQVKAEQIPVPANTQIPVQAMPGQG